MMLDLDKWQEKHYKALRMIKPIKAKKQSW